MVQTLATVLMTHFQHPSLADCEVVALSLVKFNFLNDDEGDGEVHRLFVLECVHVPPLCVCVCVLSDYYYLRELAVPAHVT